jgi:hypothetical protein
MGKYYICSHRSLNALILVGSVSIPSISEITPEEEDDDENEEGDDDVVSVAFSGIREYSEMED